MAHELSGQCWLIDFPTAPQRWTLTKLCDCADPDGTSIYPSVETVAEETNLSPSAVRAALASFRQCSLLADTEERFGNRYGKTTVVRELDTDLLRLITGKRIKGKRKVPSTHVLALVDVVVLPGQSSIQHPDAVAPSLIEPPRDSKGRPIPDETPRKLKVWAVVPRGKALAKPEKKKRKKKSGDDATPPPVGGVDENGTPPPDGEASGDVPLQEMEGHENADPSTTWRAPLQEVTSAPPPGGANPTKDPSLDPCPPTPRGLRRRGRAGRLDDFILKLRTPEREHAIDAFIEPIVRNLRITAPDPEFVIKMLADWAANHPVEVLADATKRLLDGRRTSASRADIEDALKAAIKDAKVNRDLASAPIIFSGTELFRRAIKEVEKINPTEAAWLSGQPKIKREDLEKLGVKL